MSRKCSRHRSSIQEATEDISHCYFQHLRVLGLKLSLACVKAAIRLTCSVFVVPLSRACGRIFDCNYDQAGGLKYLAFAPEIHCYAGHHLWLSIVTAIVVPVFVFLLLPFIVCGGDASYIQADELMRPSLWLGNAERYLSVTYWGFLHPVKRSFFTHQLFWFFCSAAFPIIVLETSHSAVLQTGLLSVVSVTSFMLSLAKPPLVSPKACVLMQGSKSVTAFAMLCGLYSACLEDEMSMWPALALYGGTASITIITLIMFTMRPKKPFPSIIVSSMDQRLVEV